MHKPIYIYSCGIDFFPSAELAAYLRQADRVYGSPKLFAKLPEHTAETVSITSQAQKQAEELIRYAKQGKKILVLCSGDSLFHGFGTTILSAAEAAGLENSAEFIEIIPNVTAFQALCAKCRIPWHNAKLFTAHSGGTMEIRQITNAQTAIVYGGTAFTAAAIARELCLFSPSQKNRKAVFAQLLGTEQEKIIEAPLEEISTFSASPTSVLLLLPFEAPQANSAEAFLTEQREHCLPLGLDNAVYQKENGLITHADCRAVILSRLRLLPQGIFWDLGAGSGSVGLEAAGLTQMQVYAVEKNELRCSLIKTNQKQLGIANYTAVHGEITECIAHLPPADRIFIGGGGHDICKILDMCKKYGKSNALILVSAVTLETFHLLYGYNGMPRLDLVRLSISSESGLAQKYHCLKPQNPLYLFIYQNKQEVSWL